MGRKKPKRTPARPSEDDATSSTGPSAPQPSVSETGSTPETSTRSSSPVTVLLRPQSPDSVTSPSGSTNPSAGARRVELSAASSTASSSRSSGDAGKASKATASTSSLTKSVKSLTLEGLPVPRDRHGSRGRPIGMFANFLKVAIKLKEIYMYDVEIKSTRQSKDGEVRDLPKRLNVELMKLLSQQVPQLYGPGNLPAYDALKILYTSRPLQMGPQQTNDFSVVYTNGKSETFTISIQLAKTIDLRGVVNGNYPQEAINALDIAFRQNGFNNTRLAQVGPNLYDPAHMDDLGQGRNLWHGRHQSLRPVEWAPLALNVDVTATTFYKELNVVEFARELLGLRPQDETRPFREDKISKLEKELKGLKVNIEYSGVRQKRPVQGLTRNPAATQTFKLEGTDKTVDAYFREKYNIILRYRFLPCIRIGKGQTYIPMELCTISAKQRGKRSTMTDNHSRNMIRALAKPPAQRKEIIENQIRDGRYNEDPVLRAFGITVGEKMMTLNGRVLEPPPMLYADRKSSKPFGGQWNGRNLKFHSSVLMDVNKWALVNFDNFLNAGQIQAFHNSLKRMALDLGMSWSDAFHVVTSGEIRDIDGIFEMLVKKGVKMVVVVLNEKDPNYGLIKQRANVTHGIMTQCATARTVKKSGPQDVANICLKINAKMGGTNFVPDDPFVKKSVLNVPTIIIGADVTHPDSGDSQRPSIAAVVGSEDRDAVTYSAEIRVQKRRSEPIVDLKEMTKNLLKRFFIKSGKRIKPEKLIYYRDGVGESQFIELLLTELKDIRDACTELQADYRPAITFILVQKRHHTRFFPQNPQRDGEGRHQNIPAGTIADREVTDPNSHNFYLSSHAAIQGTSRPAHYYVLCDDSRHSMDELQALSFYLSHVYSNCTRSVSVATPAYYADKACTMARHFLDSLYVGREGPGCDDDGNPTEAMKRAIMVHRNLETSMYFL